MRFFAILFGLLPLAVSAAAGYQVLTPSSISVAGGESQDVSVRFIDAQGRPAAGEAVTFSNDACGFFGNGQFLATMVANADGVATARFTASNPPGITCWIRAANGVVATVDVLTYRPSEVDVQLTIDPPHPRVGQPYNVRVRPGYGGYGLANVDVGLEAIAGTANAAVAPAMANTGYAGSAVFTVTPNAILGDYALQGSFRTRETTLLVPAAANPWQDMWWAGDVENGWGLSVVQHRDVLFITIYAYDASGKPTWYVVPGGSWNAAKTQYTGEVYAPKGTPFAAYEPAKFSVGAAIGTVRFILGDASHATLDYTISGRHGAKAISRMDFGSSDAAPIDGLGDMWWAGPAQNGWGVALLQQSKMLFDVIFTYDATGAPTWLYMPGGTWTALDTYEGSLYRTASSAWLGTEYDRSRFVTAAVGTFKLRFAGSGASATLDYVLDGVRGTVALSRDPF